MANRKRNIQMNFYVTENKKRLIDERIKLIASLPHSISFSFGNELKAESAIHPHSSISSRKRHNHGATMLSKRNQHNQSCSQAQ